MSKEIIEAMFDVLEWKHAELAFIQCPGKHFHSSKNGKKDCRVTLDGAPTIYCLHSSCQPVIEEANYKMRRAIWERNPLPKREFTDEEKLKIKADLVSKKKEQELREWADKNKEAIIKKYDWPLADVYHESPFMTDDSSFDADIFLKAMYQPEDVLWIGQPQESGEKFSEKFKTAGEWMETKDFGNFICPSVFKTGSFSRSKDNVIARPYLVLESDELTLDETGSLFKWLRGFMYLKSVIHSGGKSLHGWFAFPSDQLFKKLKILLPELGFDWHLFTASQPVRMPGVRRGESWQTILWQNYEEKKITTRI